MSTIRNFDALNDPNNLIFSAKCIKKAGLKHQLCVSMMSLPPGATGAHTPDFYEETLKKFLKAKIPFDSLCFKDASGTTVPAVVYETIRRARKLVGEKVPIQFHSHETAGAGLACYMAAVQGGADIEIYLWHRCPVERVSRMWLQCGMLSEGPSLSWIAILMPLCGWKTI